MANDFVLAGFDYVDCIKTDDDMKKFNRMKELSPALIKPVNECIKEVMEFTKLDRELRGVPPVKFLFQGNPKLN
jgi:hypothetical protein